MDLTILVDMDGVIVDTMAGFNKEFSRRFPQIPVIPLEEIREFYLERQYSPEHSSNIHQIWATPGFFAGLLPIPGSIAALHELVNQADVAICTSPFTESKTCAQEKWQWVEQYLGKEWLKRLIITKDKTRVYGNILIDDKPQITGAKESPFWEHVLYTQPWNKNIQEKRRLTWQNYKEVLTELV